MPEISDVEVQPFAVKGENLVTVEEPRVGGVADLVNDLAQRLAGVTEGGAFPEQADQLFAGGARLGAGGQINERRELLGESQTLAPSRIVAGSEPGGCGQGM